MVRGLFFGGLWAGMEGGYEGGGVGVRKEVGRGCF